jgi:hypothetical protein
MPINMSDSPLSSIKIGENNILKGYVGEGQIFPNNTEITAAAFTNSNVADTGGNEPYVVSGDIGSSFTLTGSSGATGPVGTQVLSTSPTTYQIAIDDQSTCGTPIRNPQILIAPQGNTVLAGALSNTDTIIQAAGPVYQTNVGAAIGLTVYNTVRNTITVGSQLYWNTGSQWQIVMTFNPGSLGGTVSEDLRISSSAVSPLTPFWTYVYSVASPASTTTSGDYNSAYTLTWLGTPVNTGTTSVQSLLSVNGNVGVPTVQFTAGVTDIGCITGNPTADTGLLYP